MNKPSPVCRGLAVAGLLGTMLLLGACATTENVAPAAQLAAARLLSEQSEADAVLAERKTRAAKARNAAEEMARSNEVLRTEAERKSRP